ncbi:hypothetical protein AVHY2522_16450 [Acidovorax sp. SUPP2522]|uniref:hypothetical protein n=1 Tax=unclassified Acidovorax TaxID=2684926 RepID=UPI002349073F|nr:MULTISPECIES: hypothetical protein [unclassified Acidovorax]WCM95596.1 hypothetical protein M5C96_13975 [Acidovorax sp. GBBC 1281]GKT17793.1 hypothetical protein AVHY2522_16450 [Acidovorax sp. SUPP2522]
MDSVFKKSKVPRKGRWIIVVLALMILYMGYVAWRLARVGNNAFAAGFQPPEMAAAQYTDRTVRANLGGVPVAIPPYFAEYVEYDGDPGWGEKRKGPKPVRTQESRITSFGFDVRYPDMAGKSTPELWDDYKKRRLATNQWIHVGFNSGEIYNGAGSADRIGKGSIDSVSKYWWNTYEKLKEKEHGLEVYALVGVDPKEGKPAREHRNAEDIFIKRNDAGKIETFIKCSNLEIPSPPCKQFFDLEPEMRTSVTVSYRRGLLPEWQQIQEKVKKTVLGFSVNEKN